MSRGRGGNTSPWAMRNRAEASQSSRAMGAKTGGPFRPEWADAKPGEHPHKPAKPPGKR